MCIQHLHVSAWTAVHSCLKARRRPSLAAPHSGRSAATSPPHRHQKVYVLSPIMLRTFIVVLFVAVLTYSSSGTTLGAVSQSAQSHSAQDHAAAGALGDTFQLEARTVPWPHLLPAAR